LALVLGKKPDRNQQQEGSQDCEYSSKKDIQAMWGEELDPLPASHDLLLFGSKDLLLKVQNHVSHCS